MRFTLKDIKGAVVEKKEHWSACDVFILQDGHCNCGASAENIGIDAQSSVALELDREGLLNEMVNAFKSNDQEINKALRENLKKCADAIRNAPINSILKVVKNEK